MTKEEIEAMLKKAADENEARHAKAMETITGLAGIMKTVGDSITSVKARMDSEDEKKEADRKDSARGRADDFKFGKRADGEEDDDFKKRMDAEEEKLRCDMEEAGETAEAAADKAKKRRGDADEEDKKTMDSKRKDADGDKEKEEKERADRADSVIAGMRQEIDALTGAVKGRTPEDAAEFSKVQARADSIAMATGDRARAPMLGESLVNYRLHFAEKFQDMSPGWKGKPIKMAVAAGDEIFVPVFDQILDEALKTAKSPATVKPGTLRMDTHQEGGHTFNEFHGSPSTWMDPISGHVKQAAKKFKNDGALV